MDIKKIFHLFEIGGKRNQEDFMWPLPGTATLHDNVYIVCDGVGGSENGELASRIICESVGKAMQDRDYELDPSYIAALLNNARNELIHHALSNGLSPDMATTFTMVAFKGNKAIVAWCGDSRVYQIRDGNIVFKTSDHSLVNSLVKSGEITEEEANVHPRKNIILRAIKADESLVEADFEIVNDIRSDDYFLLCTDGLLENISDEDLCNILSGDNRTTNLTEVFRLRCEGRTKDNYSMYLLKVKLSEVNTSGITAPETMFKADKL